MVKTTDEARSAAWAKTERLATGITDHGIGGAVRKYFLIYFPLGAVVLVGLLFLAFNLIFGSDRDAWGDYLTYALMVAGVAAMIGGMVYGFKRVKPLVQPERAAALVWLEKSERKSIQNQILGRTPPSPGDLAVARGAAVQIRQGAAQGLLTMPGYFLLFGPQLVNTSGGLITVLLGVCMLGFAVATIMTIQQFRATGRFLKNTAASVTS